jgi:quinol monooxygenase YgiN
MSEPFIFIGTHRLKEGKLQDFEKSFGELVQAVEANEPRLIAFNGYVNDDGTEVAVVQVHPDAASMELHMRVAREHITHAYEELLDETTSIQIFGELSDAAREMMQQLAGSGVPLSVKPQPLGGFTRSHAG